MIGLLFVAFLLTIIIGMVIASSSDELHGIYLKVIDALHRSPAEQYYKQMRKTQLDGSLPPLLARSFDVDS